MEEKKLCRKPHEGRKNLTGEHKIGDAGQVILFLLFFIVWIVDCFFFEFSDILFQNLSLYIRLPIAILILAVSGYLAKTGLKIVFDEIHEKPEVIDKGVFSLVRHPIYLASILLYVAFLIFKLSLASFIVWIAIILFYHFIARYEEKLLLEHFGSDYENYLQSVPMWIPALKKGK